MKDKEVNNKDLVDIKGVCFVPLKKINKNSIYKNSVIINENGVSTNDKKGDKFYRGQQQANIKMTVFYFGQAQKFWANQVVNGQPMKLIEVQVIAAANSVIPYNSPSKKSLLPKLADRDDLNNVGWYNVKFEKDETGWICSSLYPSGADAARSVAADVVYKIYNDKKIIAWIRSVMEKQK